MREGIAGDRATRMGNARWRCLTEERAGRTKSVFHFDVQGSVAKPPGVGIAWLRLTRERLGQGDQQHEVFCIAAWLSRADQQGMLPAFLDPDLTPGGAG